MSAAGTATRPGYGQRRGRAGIAGKRCAVVGIRRGAVTIRPDFGPGYGQERRQSEVARQKAAGTLGEREIEECYREERALDHNQSVTLFPGC
jgi:hypothetical protein